MRLGIVEAKRINVARYISFVINDLLISLRIHRKVIVVPFTPVPPVL